jgi:hypothetical protein
MMMGGNNERHDRCCHRKPTEFTSITVASRLQIDRGMLRPLVGEFDLVDLDRVDTDKLDDVRGGIPKLLQTMLSSFARKPSLEVQAGLAPSPEYERWLWALAYGSDRAVRSAKQAWRVKEGFH